MERILCCNSFVNSRNRLLFRYPIYRKFMTGERFSNPISSHTKIAKPNLYVDYINCRYESSSGNDGNVQKLQYKAVAPVRKKYFKSLKTNVTQVTETSSSQKQHSVKLVTGSNLPKFLNESVPSAKSNTDVQPLQLKEEPLVYIPDNVKDKLANNSTMFEKFLKSFDTFIRFNPPPIEEAISESQNKLKASVASKPLPDTDTDLQKEYDPVTQNDFVAEKSLNENLKCYLNACISENLTDRAYAVLMSIRQTNKYRKRKFKLNDIELYSDLMAKYSSMRNWNGVNGIYDILVAEKIPITPQIYMNILDCLGRQKENKSNTTLIKKFIDQAQQQDISVNDIMDKSKFIRDQRAFALRAIRRVELSFKPNYTPPQLAYSNKLLQALNEDVLSIDVPPKELLQLNDECLISASKVGFDASELSRLTAEQIVNETEGHITVKNVTMLDPNNVTEKMKFHRELLAKLTDQWRVDIATAIRKRLGILQHKMKANSMKTINIYPYMRLLTPEQYTDIMLEELKSLADGCELYSPTVVQIYGNIGLKVLQKYQMKLREQNGINQKVRHMYKTYREILCSGKCPDNPRQLWQRIIYHSQSTGPSIFQPDIDWPWAVRCDVGRTLFKILLENIKIDANLLDSKTSQVNYVPVVYSLFRKRDHLSREEIRPHPSFIQLMHEAKLDTMKFNTNEAPMICPPVPWTSASNGGYLHTHKNLLRLPIEFSYQNELMKAAPPEQLYPPLDAVNQLGSIPWQVNTRILDLAIKIFNFGGDDKLDVPLTPDNMVTDEHLKYRGKTREQFDSERNFYDEMYHQRQNELLSMYTDTLYKLSLAHHFRDRPFWLPTNLDFRGRSYPIPPHLTHLSADLTRSMLCFHQKQPLGEKGLEWLKLHCINLTGMKKRDSIVDRLDYANQIIDDIIDSADHPLDGRQWWLKSDEPWQTLATCFEIADAIRSPNPAEYMTGFPVHQDGSCNGLQHYAALGRDYDGAASVNLTPAKVPQDVYSEVANRVEAIRQKDAANGVQIAIDLEGIVKRKIIKQTVMTTVYGVTEFGARLQIKKQLKCIGFKHESLGHASSYLTRKTFESLSAMFSSAREIQNWLTTAARYISNTNNPHHVEWTSPLGLPVIQPYTRETKLQSNLTVSSVSHKKLFVNKVKEKNAFSPNFIHSLDSCHMMLTSLNCEKAGITFVSVHDCFWTHPSTVPIMNRICREQFILLHSQPILEDLAESFYQKYEIDYKGNSENSMNKSLKKKSKKSKDSTSEVQDLRPIPKNNHIFMKLPKKGHFDLNSVLDSTYFFS